MLQVQITGLNRLFGAIQTAPEVLVAAELEAMQLSVHTVEAEAKRLVPRRTGRLFSSIEARVEQQPGVIEGRVFTNVEYAPPVEFGAVAHEIAPVTAQALRFEIGGRTVFAARVHHPGNKPRPFMRPALERSVPAIREYFAVAMRKVAAHLAHG